MKKISIIASFLCIVSLLCMFSCKKENVDISGYYTADRMNTLYYFSPDGKIYENESFESFSCYEVQGDKLITYIEDAREASEMVFPFKLTDEGFMMGELEYRKIPDPEPRDPNNGGEEQSPDEEQNENS
ncbi:MAG: hypothetical protein E7656_05920 [Ruminococcaceae bacterium]|nr:hypothetical protein [Oscillospiraceae bacterium]